MNRKIISVICSVSALVLITGYLDAPSFMMATFAITGLVVLLNVWMKRLQGHGRVKYLNILDTIGVWFYPLLYLGGGGLMFVLFRN